MQLARVCDKCFASRTKEVGDTVEAWWREQSGVVPCLRGSGEGVK